MDNISGSVNSSESMPGLEPTLPGQDEKDLRIGEGIEDSEKTLMDYGQNNNPEDPSYLTRLGIELVNGDDPENADYRLSKPTSKCEMSLVIAAKDEEERIGPMLESLSIQEGLADNLDSFEVIIIVNNCTDSTIEAAQLKIEEINKKLGDEGRTDRLQVHLIDVKFKDGEGGVGKASKLGMDIAFSRETPIIARDDADSIFEEKWVSGILETFKKTGAGAVGGEIETNPEDSIILTPEEQLLLSKYYDEYFEPSIVLNRIQDAQKLGIEADESSITGATAITRLSYAQVDGMTTEKSGQKFSFRKKLNENGIKVVQASDLGIEVRVLTSGRADGRTGGGAAKIISEVQKAVSEKKELIVSDPENKDGLIPIEGAIQKLKERPELKDYYEKEKEQKIKNIVDYLNNYFIENNLIEALGSDIYEAYIGKATAEKSKMYLNDIKGHEIIKITEIEGIAKDLVEKYG